MGGAAHTSAERRRREGEYCAQNRFAKLTKCSCETRRIVSNWVRIACLILKDRCYLIND